MVIHKNSLFLLLLLIQGLGLVLSQWPASSQNKVGHLPGEWSEQYTKDVSKNMYYSFKYETTADKSVGVRVFVEVEDATEEFPVNVVVWEERGVLSWELPWIIEDSEQRRYNYSKVVRTICSSTQSDDGAPELITLSMSTLSPHPLSTTMRLELVPIQLQINDEVDTTVEPAQPHYKRFTFPDDVDTVVVHVESDDEVCMVLSVQDSKCPVYDLIGNVEYAGSYQTVTKKGAITVPRSQFKDGSFFVVLVVQANDDECTLDVHPLHKLNPVKEGSQLPFRDKNVTVFVKEGPKGQYLGQTLGAAGISIAVAIVLILLYFGLIHLIKCLESPCCDAACCCCEEAQASELKLYHLAKQSKEITNVKNKVYPMNFLVVCIYYAIPVLQLLITYHTFKHLTGDEDVCYYNFACIRPYGVLKSFNNIFSNIGYGILGLTFIIVVFVRQRMSRNDDADKGVPNHFSLLYAIGLALIMEGIMSGCYHVCPNYAIFQFDTSYMFMICWLCMLKLYQNRHPDLLISAQAAYLAIALLVLVAVIGVVSNRHPHLLISAQAAYLAIALLVLVAVIGVLQGHLKLVFWIIFGIVHILVSLFLTTLVCLYGHSDGNIFSRLKNGITDTGRPKYVCRLLAMILGSVVNTALAIWGMVDPRFFASQLLYICVGNLALYLGYYICMKVAYREKVLAISVFGILTVVMWIVSLHFFTSEVTNWKLSPAQSRSHNEDCIVLDFYDKHDVWHYCSAISLFLSLCMLLVIDDDIKDMNRTDIPVF